MRRVAPGDANFNRGEFDVSFDPNLDGPFAPVRVASGDHPPEWPVLARLPLVGPRPATSGERLPTYAALEPANPAAAAVRMAAPLRIVEAEPVNVPADRATTHYAMRIDPPQFRGQAIVAEPTVVGARRQGWTLADEPALPVELITPPAPPRRAQYRVDPAEDRFGGAHLPRRQPDDSLASRIAWSHAALAPYAGVTVMAALILTASLLYWLTVGGQQSAIDGDAVMDSQNSWSSETPVGPPVSAVDEPLDHEIQELSDPPSTPDSPRVADAAVVAPETSTPAPPRVDPSARSEGPALSSGEPPSPAIKSAAPIAAAPITPTPHDLPYPVTDYPWFEFSLTPPNSAVPPAAAQSAAAGNAVGQEATQ